MQGNKSRLYTYTMTTDSGLGPNPFWGKMTLATCKHLIRKGCREGDWIAGFAGNTLEGLPVPPCEKKLVYLMQVKEKIRMEDYYQMPEFQNKIPDLESKDPFRRIGDNIYRFPVLGTPCIVKHHHCRHPKKDKEFKGLFILVAEVFFYFGRMRTEIKEHKVKIGQRGHLNPESQDCSQVKGFISYAEVKYNEMLKTVDSKDFSRVHRVPLPDFWYDGVSLTSRKKNGQYQGRSKIYTL